MSAMNNTTEIVAYKPTEAVLADLASRYKGAVFDVTTIQGMQEAKAAYRDINEHSLTLERARVAEKAASLAYGKFVDSEARRISEKLDSLRLPIKDQIEAETKRIEREREAAIKAEQERIEAEQRAKREAEEKKLAEERAEIARERAKIETEKREAQARIDAAERAARAEREEADRIARAARQVEEDRLRAERAIIEKAKREQEEKERAERMAKEQAERTARLAEEAKQRAVQKAENDKTDARGMLSSFVQRYGGIQEFAGVVKAILEYQEGL